MLELLQLSERYVGINCTFFLLFCIFHNKEVKQKEIRESKQNKDKT
jgi:hypothetical protein